jgi:DNA-binding LytR/AlgR family response regulator
MAPLRLLLCDDEPLALDRLTELASRCADVAVAGALLSGRELIERLGEAPADVVLLDIEMPHMDGFDVVEALARIEWDEGSPPPLIIFVTAHPEFAVDAFDSGALDFISKPVRLSRLEQALERARRATEQIEARRRLGELSDQLDALKRAHAGTSDERHIWVRKGTETIRLDLDEVDWVEAEGEYVRFHAAGDSYLERGSLTDAAAMLEPAGFVRIHRSAIVNARRVSAIGKGPWGGLTLHLGSGARVPVGKKYRDAARALTRDRLPPAG